MEHRQRMVVACGEGGVRKPIVRGARLAAAGAVLAVLGGLGVVSAGPAAGDSAVGVRALWGNAAGAVGNIRSIPLKEARFVNVDIPTAVAALADMFGFWAGIEALEGDEMAFGGQSSHTFSLTARNMTVDALLSELMSKDPRYIIEFDYEAGTVNVQPRNPPDAYWAERKVASFAFDGGTVWDALDAILRVPDLSGEPLRIVRQGGPWPQVDAPNGPFDRDGDPICFSLRERKGRTVRQLLDLVVWKASAFWPHRWVALPRTVRQVGRDGGTRPAKREVLIGLSVGSPLPANQPGVQVSVVVDPSYRRKGHNPNGPDW